MLGSSASQVNRMPSGLIWTVIWTNVRMLLAGTVAWQQANRRYALFFEKSSSDCGWATKYSKGQRGR
jgi:hypothetical protein